MEVILHGDLIIKRFENPFKGSNSFLMRFVVSEDLWLFDAGDSPQLLDELKGRELKGVFLTHSHFDHISGIKEITSLHPECTIYGSEKCIEWLSDDRRNLSFYYERPLCFKPIGSHVLADGAELKLNSVTTLKAVYTPGHSEDSMSYVLNSVLVSGDSLIPNVPPVTKLKGGNKEDYQKSRKRLETLINRGTLLLPGHGPVFKGRSFEI